MMPGRHLSNRVVENNDRKERGMVDGGDYHNWHNVVPSWKKSE